MAMDTSYPREEQLSKRRWPPAAPEPRDHLVWAIFNTLYMNICCLGFVALAFAVKVRDRRARGLRESLPPQTSREGCPRRHRALGINPGRADPNTLRKRVTPAAGESSLLFLPPIREVVGQPWITTAPCPPPEGQLLDPKKCHGGRDAFTPPQQEQLQLWKDGDTQGLEPERLWRKQKGKSQLQLD